VNAGSSGRKRNVRTVVHQDRDAKRLNQGSSGVREVGGRCALEAELDGGYTSTFCRQGECNEISPSGKAVISHEHQPQEFGYIMSHDILSPTARDSRRNDRFSEQR